METKHQNNFDFLRFALASLVIFSHSFDLTVGREGNPVLRFTHNQMELGSLAVDGFFILSGFLITASFLNSRHVWSYLAKRALRIYPGFIICAGVCLLFFAPLPMGFSREYWQQVNVMGFLRHLPGLQPLWIPDTFTTNHWPYVNSVIWTIQYEAVCYLFTAGLGVLGILRRRTWVLGLWVLCFGLYMVTWYGKVYLWNWQELPIGGVPDYYPRFMTYFFAGSVGYLYRDRLRWNLPLALMGLALTAMLSTFDTGLEAVQPIPLAYFLLCLAHWPNRVLSQWGRYGDFSYGLYLYGWPVQQTVIYFLGARATPWNVFPLALLGALLLAIGSWYAIERPFLRMKPRGRPAPTVLPTQAGL